MNLEETLYYEVIKNGITENQILEYEKALKNYPIENVDYFEGLDNKLKLQAERIRIFGKNDFGVIDENDKSAMEKAERNANTVKAYLDYKKAIVSNKTTAPQFSPAETLVMAYFPRFKNDYPILIDKGYMKKNGNFLRWEKSQKLLAEYFGNLERSDSNRHWHDIENLFSEINLAQAFQNSKSINQSKDYQKLLNDLKV